MPFLDILFPERISANAQGGPRFFTTKVYTATGHRSVNREALYPLHEYTVTQPVRSGSDFEELRAFFYVAGGDESSFKFKDWSDYVATQANSRLTLVSGSIYQLNRVYGVQGQEFIRPISKPADGAVVYRTRSGVTTTATATVDTATGQATISGHASGDTYTWEGRFFVPVAFKDPQAVWTIIGTSGFLTEWSGIVLEEVRL